jgi:D-alanyl-D-alanine carboxypeptidase
MSVAPTHIPHRRRKLRHPLPWVGVILVAVGVVLLLQHDVFQDGSATAHRPELQRAIDAAVTGPNRIAPGATAYVRGPHGSWLGAAGIADTGSRAPMRPEARMRIETVSKIYTATVILRLAQERKLTLHDTVERWLPGLFSYGNKLRIDQLMSMSSGLIDNNDLLRTPARYLTRVKDAQLQTDLIALGKRIDANPAVEMSPSWWIKFAAWQPLLFEPGTSYHYSNIGYDLLGRIAERSSGKRISQLYEETIFKPLDLDNTSYDPQGPIDGPHARGYNVAADGKLTDATNQHFGVGADGGIVSNAKETAAFLTALMAGRVVDGRQLRAMRGSALWNGGTASDCAEQAFGWSGGGIGFKSEVWVNAHGSRVAVLLLNGRVAGDVGDPLAFATMRRLYCAA